MPEHLALTVGITTRNRPQSLLRCLASLDLLGDVLTEVIVVDDSSDVPVADSLDLPPSMAAKMRVVRQTASEGYIVARNTIMRLAVNEYVLLLDDDAYLIGADGLKEALAIMERHAEVAAIGCAQAEADGSPWPAAMQPAPVSYRCRVASYIGFAHLLRRRAFHEVGGYQEALHFYGEEKGFCARFLKAGYQVVYMPDALVAHVPDPQGRSSAALPSLRHPQRLSVCASLSAVARGLRPASAPSGALFLHEPRSTRSPIRPGSAGLCRNWPASLPAVFRTRTPMTWANLADWRQLRRHPPAWPA